MSRQTNHDIVPAIADPYLVEVLYMRKSLQAVLAIIALGVAFSSLNLAVDAQRTGGFREVAKDDPEVEAAANFAVEEQGRKQEASLKLVSIERAESQVVAGINYRLCLKVSKEGEDEADEVKAVVYKNLQKEYSLTSWAEENCSESGDK
ncbi:MAG TPA: cystatin domain-containing protein [Pyrinomonadaceae bacterium]|nr:cystatin domain-containing protein [Pyrinomonadaceae bacterium]